MSGVTDNYLSRRSAGRADQRPGVVDSLMAVDASRPVLALLTILMMACLGINWLVLADAGLTLRPVHLVAAALVACLAVRPPYPPRLMAALSRTRFFSLCLALAVLTAIKLLSLAMFPLRLDSAKWLVKESIYIVLGVAMMLAFYTLLAECRSGARTLRRGALVAIAVFVATVTLLFASRGENVVVSYLTDVAQADTQRLQHYYYNVIFEEMDAGESASAALRNSIIGVFVLFFVILLATRDAVESSRGRLMTWLGAGACVFIVLTSVSRSNILALAFTITIPLMVGSLRTASRLRSTLVLGAVGAVFAAGLFAAVDLSETGVGRIVTDRFGEGIANDGRWKMFRESVVQATDKPLWGHGFAATIDYPGARETVRVHNVVLASFYEMGAPGLAASAVLLGVVLLAWADGLRLAIFGQDVSHLGFRAIWAATLPTLPVIRLLVAGNAGQLSLVDWACLALYFAWWAAAVADRIAPDDPPATEQSQRQRPRPALPRRA